MKVTPPPPTTHKERKSFSHKTLVVCTLASCSFIHLFRLDILERTKNTEKQNSKSSVFVAHNTAILLNCM